MKGWVLFILLVFQSVGLLAQPGNDECANATKIEIEEDGWKIGKVKSVQSGFLKATVEFNEPFYKLAQVVGLDQKSVWYYFEIPTCRDVKIKLKQKQLKIDNNMVGFTVYRMEEPQPDYYNMMTQPSMSVIQFGSVQNCCIQKGRYYVQVLAKASVVDSIFLQLEINRSCGSFDSYENAADITNKNNIYFNNECNGLDSLEELNNNLGIKANHVYYANINTPAYFNQVFLSFSAYKSFGWELYEVKDSIKRDWLLIEEVSLLDTGKLVKQYKCGKLKPSTQYLFKFYVEDYFHIKNSWVLGAYPSKANNLQKLNPAFALGKVKNGKYTVEDRFSCNPKAYQFACEKVKKQLIDSYYFRFKKWPDTLKAGFWTTFEVTQQMKLNGLPGPLDYFAGRVNYKCFLFKGDPSQEPCNLKRLVLDHANGEIKYCLKPGKYALFVGCRLDSFMEDAKGRHFLLRDFNLGKGLRLQLTFEEATPIKYSLFSDTTYPANLGPILNQFGYAQRKTPPDNFGAPRQKFNLLNKDIIGHFSFTKFYLDKPVYVQIIPTGMPYIKNLFLKGDISKGSKTLYKTDSMGQVSFDGFRSWGALGFYTSAGKLDTGWYTIVSWVESIDTCYWIKPLVRNQILARPDRVSNKCKEHFNRPHLANILNYGKPISIAPIEGKEPSPYDTWIYRFLPCAYTNKNQKAPTIYKPKENADKFAYPSYFVFTINEPVQFNISRVHFQLFKGSINVDSVRIFNEKNLIYEDYSSQDIELCKLEAGTYTLITGGTRRADNFDFSLRRHYNPSYNWAQNALDLGLISNEQVKFQTLVFPCSNTADTSHTAYQTGNQNMWITAQLKEPGIYKFNISGPYIEPTFYKVTENANLPYNELKSKGLIDSTNKYNNKILRANYVHYNKKGTDYERFQFVLNRPISALNEKLELSYYFENDSLATTVGDFCQNAVSMVLDDTLNHELKVWNSIHTIGEGYGEHDSIQELIFNERTANLKTSWFKIEIPENKEGYSLNLYPNYSNASSRLYYGNCDALTPAGLINNNSKVGLSCLGKGNYYIQNFSYQGQKAYSQIGFNLENEGEPCMPLNTESVLANFSASGGCDGIPVKFTNLSTQGSDMVYAWNFGDGSTSSDISPSHKYNNTKKKDTMQVTLVVLNKKSNHSDTVQKDIAIYKKFPFFPIPNDTNILCIDTTLKDSAKYGSGISFQWWMRPGFIYNPYLPKPIFNPERVQSEVYVQMKFGNCSKRDSFNLTFERFMEPIFENRGLFCEGDTLLLGYTNPPSSIEYTWNTGSNKSFILADSAGLYQLVRKQKSCKDSIQFSIIKRPLPPTNFADTVCENHVFYVGNNEWRILYNGDTLQSIYVNGRNNIPFKYVTVWPTHNPNCTVDDTLTFKSLKSVGKSLSDTFLCNDLPLTLNAELPNATYYWSTGDTTSAITTTQPSSYFLWVFVQNCQRRDTIEVSEIANLGLPNDTNICDSIIPFFVQAKNADNYIWNNYNHSNSLLISKAGNYLVEGKKGECVINDTFTVTQDCPSTLYVPNAFTPGKDDINPIFLPKGTEISNYVMRIYAQTGQIVFFSKELNRGWDGTIKGEIAPIGTYFYIIEYSHNGEKKQSQGNLQLIR